MRDAQIFHDLAEVIALLHHDHETSLVVIGILGRLNRLAHAERGREERRTGQQADPAHLGACRGECPPEEPAETFDRNRGTYPRGGPRTGGQLQLLVAGHALLGDHHRRYQIVQALEMLPRGDLQFAQHAGIAGLAVHALAPVEIGKHDAAGEIPACDDALRDGIEIFFDVIVDPALDRFQVLLIDLLFGRPVRDVHTVGLFAADIHLPEKRLAQMPAIPRRQNDRVVDLAQFVKIPAVVDVPRDFGQYVFAEELAPQFLTGRGLPGDLRLHRLTRDGVFAQARLIILAEHHLQAAFGDQHAAVLNVQLGIPRYDPNLVDHLHGHLGGTEFLIEAREHLAPVVFPDLALRIDHRGGHLLEHVILNQHIAPHLGTAKGVGHDAVFLERREIHPQIALGDGQRRQKVFDKTGEFIALRLLCQTGIPRIDEKIETERIVRIDLQSGQGRRGIVRAGRDQFAQTRDLRRRAAVRLPRRGDARTDEAHNQHLGDQPKRQAKAEFRVRWR